jgi:two-component system CheB/CheR fusion protein
MSETNNTHYTNLQPNQRPTPIVAIGGSAGGQQAMVEFLKHLPTDTGLAYVYIQHLSPNYDSQLVSIFARQTSIPVIEAAHLMPVQPDHLYIIPPGKDMEVIDGVLVLMQRKPRPQLHLPIDQFFISLARRQKDGAMGIILSGMASDGTLGLEAIKVAGGITFAQNETATYQSMPQSAINQGVVDLILPPDEIAREVARLSKKADIFQLTSETAESNEQDAGDMDLDEILTLVKSAVSVDFKYYKKSTIRRRIIRRMLLYKLETLREYTDYLKQHHTEAALLYNDLLIHVTSFFRDPETMAYVKEELIPKILGNKLPSEPVRIWIAGCSTGQEAYTMAMILMEVLGDRAASVPIQIFATDLSGSAIDKARTGIFTPSEVTEVSADRIERFFTKVDAQYRINKLIRDLCVFAPHNLLNDPPFSRMDLISCRNLLIYLDDVLQKKVFSLFHYAMKPDGFLLLGKSESVGSFSTQFTRIEKVHKVFTRKYHAQAKIPINMSFKKNSSPLKYKVTSAKNNDPVSVHDLDKLVDNLLLSQYVPASIVVDQDLEIIQFRGATGPFLQHSPGKASLNLTKMAHPSLVFELRNIILKTRQSGKTVKKSGLEVKSGKKTFYANIEAVPITNTDNQQLFMVLFEELNYTPGRPGEADENQVLVNDQLEAELTALRQDMHTIIEEQEASNEELQSANEEIVSSNEELQSINEELETTKEEIEAANEELQTINQELQIRNDQLTESYEYSEAILSTIKEATLVLDEQLRVKTANKAFHKIFKTDHFSTEEVLVDEFGNGQLNFPGFRDMLYNVLSKNETIEGFEVPIRISNSEERIMVIHACKAVHHQKQTVLIVFEDITGHRKAQQLLHERQQWFEDLVDSAPAMIWVCNTDQKVTFLNKAWIEYTGQPFATEEDTFLKAIHPDDRESYLNAFNKHVGIRKPFSIEYRLCRHNGEYHWVLENAKPMYGSDGTFTGYIGSSTDVHLQKTLSQQLNQHVDERTQQLKEANLELSQTADRLQSVLNGVPALVTLMQPVRSEDGDVIDFTTSVFNDQALQLTGQSPQQILTKTLLETNPQLKGLGLMDLYTQVLGTGEPAYREFTGIRSIGDTLAFLITRQVDLSGIVVTALDVTTRKQTELQLVETAESLQAVLDSAPSSIVFFKALYDQTGENTDFVLVVCNYKFSENFGKPVRELTGIPASELFTEALLSRMKKVLTAGKPYYEEYYIEKQEKWVGRSMTRHDHGVAITEMDISLLKTAQSRQNELIQQLNGSYETVQSLSVMKEYVQQRGSFLRSTFHDLRGSFGIIVGAATLLDMINTEEERFKVQDMIQRNLRQITQMMNQLLDYSRLESGEEKLDVKPFDAALLLTELSESSARIASEKGLYIHCNGPEMLAVEGDSVKLRRIAQNLILNAIKYTHQGGITLSWQILPSTDQSTANSWEFSIRDTGPGIPQKLLTKILDSINSPIEPNGKNSEPNPGIGLTAGSGEGIGLFIVKHLCKLLLGKMYVESHRESGTTFRIIIPVSYSEK